MPNAKWVSLLVLGGTLLLLGSRAVAAEQGLAEAERLFWTGRYEEAEQRYEALLAEQPVAAAVGWARCRLAVGQTEQAEKRLMQAAGEHPQAARLPAELAHLAVQRGDYAAAERYVARALRLDPDQPAARWFDAELARLAGRLEDADRAYGRLVDFYERARPVDDPSTLHWIGLATAQQARWHRRHDQFRRLVNRLYPELLQRQPNYWPAHLEAARLFLEKYNQADATVELNAALAINPRAAEVHAVRAQLALQNYDLPAAERSIRRALQLNPRLLAAQQLHADLLLADFHTEQAIAVLEAARQLNPAEEQTLGRLAAAYGAVDGLRQDPAGTRMAALIEQATASNPHCGQFFYWLAVSLERLRKFPHAADYYEQAQRRLPQLPGVAGQLGLMYMRLGQERRGARLLEQAFDADPFNVRVKNMLEVLDVLQGYAVLETEHFVIRFDRGHDELLARYAARYLEQEVYPDIVQRMGYVPPDKSLIQIFNRARSTSGHGWFSARMVGLPYVGTVGACGGKMVAMVSPQALPQPFNWARVLRHEFVHLVNLQQTDFNLPHWYAEALAVHHEGWPRPPAWNRLLAQRARAGRLFDLDTINHGFARPASSDDWTLAYCQAALYADYLLDAYGQQALNRLLAAYSENQTTAEALRTCFDVEQADFEQGYQRFVKQIVARVPDEPEQQDLARLSHQAALKLQDGQWQQAARLYQTGAERDPYSDRWLKALARLYLQHGQHQPLTEVLAQLAERDADNKTFRLKLAQLALQRKDYPDAARWANQVLYTDVMDANGHALLAEALRGQQKYRPAIEELETAIQLNPRQVEWRLALAEVCLLAKQPPQARQALLQLLEIAPDHLAAQQLLESLQ